MSGPVAPPLQVTEVDGTPSGRPITKIIVSNGDLSISGKTATIDTSGTGVTLTDTQVGYGSSSNTVKGSSLFTYDDTTNAEKLTIASGGTGVAVRIQSNTAVSSTNGPKLQLVRAASDTTAADGLGRIEFVGSISGSETSYGHIELDSEDGTATAGMMNLVVRKSASSTIRIMKATTLATAGQGVVWNPEREDVDFRVQGNSSAQNRLFYVDADGFVGIGGNSVPSTSGAQLQVDEDATFLRHVTNGYTSGAALTTAQCKGGIVWANMGSGSQELALPAGALGMHITVANVNANGVTIVPDGSDTINGGSSVTTTTVNQVIELFFIDTNRWVAYEPAVAA
tara:strand:- start:2397 stop:3416 length:1020 start_codon:yes stop_codon:yes gene_type:complete